jgi:large subunit ribosomal protein L25
MAQSIELKASARSGVGKGAARAVRRLNRVPGVIYGDKQPAEPISMDYKELHLQYLKGGFRATVMNVNVDGKVIRVIPRDIQLDPVRDFPVHVDFQRLGPGAKIRVAVPMLFVDQDKSPGIKRGGVFNVVRREIEVICPADAIPESLTASLDGLEIGTSLHISAVTLPPGVTTAIKNRDFTIATIAGAKASEEEAKPTPGASAAAPAAGDAAKADAAKGDDKAGAKPGAKPGAAKAEAPKGGKK